MTAPIDPPVRELEPDAPDRAGTGGPELVRVPARSFLMIDGRGDPNTADEYRDAVAALFGLSYALKFGLGKELGLASRVGALEGLWWADDMDEFTTDRRSDWQWTMMIRQPDAVTPERYARATEEVGRKKGLANLGSVRLEGCTEGLCAQVVHLGPYHAEGPTIARLHAFIRELPAGFDGRVQKHHEIYLSDARRTSPDALRTIIRQPITMT